MVTDTQCCIEVLCSNTSNVRDTQVNLEVLYSNISAIRNTQITIETLNTNTSAVRNSQISLEVLSKIRHGVENTQTSLEIINACSSTAIDLTQIVLEVLRASQIIVPPPPIIIPPIPVPQYVLSYTFHHLPPGISGVLVDDLYIVKSSVPRAKIIRSFTVPGTGKIKFDLLRDSIYSLLILDFNYVNCSRHRVFVGNQDKFELIWMSE